MARYKLKASEERKHKITYADGPQHIKEKPKQEEKKREMLAATTVTIISSLELGN